MVDNLLNIEAKNPDLHGQNFSVTNNMKYQIDLDNISDFTWDANGARYLYRLSMAHFAAGDNYTGLVALAFSLSTEELNEARAEYDRVLAQLGFNSLSIYIMKTNRVGHLSCEPDSWLRAQSLSKTKSLQALHIFICNSEISNIAFFNILKRHITIVESNCFYQLFRQHPTLLSDEFYRTMPYDLMSTFYPRKEANSLLYKGVAETMLLNMAKIYRASCRVLDLNSLENQQAQSTLKKFGVLPADKVVCLHVRDAEYLDKLSRKDFSYHDYRDVDIQSYELAVKYLIDKGFKVIRIGVSSNQVLNIQTPSYLDMTQFSADDERALAEIYLIRNCVFYIGTTSGPASVAAAFDTPTLLVNTTPIWHHYGLKSRSIFKFIQRENQTLNFIDIANGLTITDSVDKKIIDCFDGHELDKNDLRYIDNTQEDILAAVVEFESLVLNDNFDMELTSLQQEYLSKIPSNHGLLAGPGIVANSFLEIHRSLFHIP